MSVRVRFAPSPTGALHVGGARTALFNYLFARKYQGTFIIRIEDTDQDRNQEHFVKEQLLAFDWLGLKWDEGLSLSSLLKGEVKDVGDFGPYRQSQRLDIYKRYAEELLQQGQAYYCFLTDDEITTMREKAIDKKEAFRVKSPYRDWDLKKALKKKEEGQPAVVRFRVSDDKKEYKIVDGVRGEVVFPSDMVGDFILMRSNGLPVYNFSCAIDDALMKITHVFRAEEHLANTLRQLMVLEALDFSFPNYLHLSLILDKDKKKLSKRAGALSCLEYKKEGYLPEALNNFLALLGWSSEDGKEVFTMEELIKNFSEKRLNPAGAVFDVDKLNWINSQHLWALSDKDFWALFDPLVKDLNLPQEERWKSQAWDSLKSSFTNLKEAVLVFRLFDPDIYEIEKDVSDVVNWSSTPLVLKKWKEGLLKLQDEYVSLDQFKKLLDEIKKDLNIKGKFLFMPIRLAMIGRVHGFELNKVVSLLKRDVLLKRVEQALKDLF